MMNVIEAVRAFAGRVGGDGAHAARTVSDRRLVRCGSSTPLRTLALCAVSLALSACGDSTSPEDAEPCVLTGIGVSPLQATVELGQTVDLSAAVEPVTCRDAQIVWSTDNAGVATVARVELTAGPASTGRVSGVGEGTARIIATADTFAVSAVITVEPPETGRPAR